MFEKYSYKQQLESYDIHILCVYEQVTVVITPRNPVCFLQLTTKGLQLLLLFTNMKAVCVRKADFPHTVSNCTCAATENHLLFTLRKQKHLVRKWLLAGLFLGNT